MCRYAITGVIHYIGHYKGYSFTNHKYVSCNTEDKPCVCQVNPIITLICDILPHESSDGAKS